MHSRILIGIMAIPAIALIGFLLLSCSPEDNLRKLETVTIAVPPLEQNTLLYIAEYRKIFSRHRLNVVIKDFDTGVTSIDERGTLFINLITFLIGLSKVVL